MLYIKSVKTGKLLQGRKYLRLVFCDSVIDAMTFPALHLAHAYIIKNCSKTSRCHIVYFDGFGFWNVSKSIVSESSNTRI